MNRTIIFRGKRLDNGEWVEGYLTKGKSWKTDGLTPHILSEYDGRLVLNEIDPTTIGQFTGITDDDETKIFEGDIVLSTWKETVGDYGEFELCSDEGTVSWDDNLGRWTVTDTADSWPLYDYGGDRMIVVSNIHELRGENDGE